MDFYPTTTTAQNSSLSPMDSILSGHSIPYLIITINYVLFKLLRSLVNRIVAYYHIEQKPSSHSNGTRHNRTTSGTTKLRLLKLFIDELISTCELCADCAELNVVYEKHGSLAYGLSLFVLTYLWMDAFGEAHTTPGYLVEDYFLVEGSQTLRTGATYARFIGQSLAMPLAWRFASLYWGYRLLSEHRDLLMADNCKSALSTSTVNGFLIEFFCCMLCRLIELFGHRMLESSHLSQRMVSLFSSFACTSLVVLALELSGGYFNPVLAASLEFGCKGIHLYQHAVVFWVGPLLGHVMARALFKWLAGQPEKATGQSAARSGKDSKRSNEGRRLTRSSSQRKKHSD